MFKKPLVELEKNDIELIIKNGEIENRTLDYKQELPGNKDQDKVECLADISSFANASGGYIIYGLADKRDAEGKNTGIPEYLGLGIVNIDQEKQRFENMLLNGIAPRINGIQFKEVGGFDNGPVFVIYIPRSWAAPHMVKFKNHYRFYSRNSSGKYPLDIDEIRAAFAQSEALPERIREFRLHRIAKIIEGDTSVSLLQGLKYVLDIIPFDAFKHGTLHDLSTFVFPGKEKLPLAHWGGQIHTKYNLEGVVASRVVGPDWKLETYVYTQLYRNGIIEAVWMPYNPNTEGHVENDICVEYEKSVVSSIEKFFGIQKGLGVAPPICTMVSLLETKGRGLTEKTYVDHASQVLNSLSLKEERLLLPEVIFESFDVNVLEGMKPVFDIVLNAAGVSRAEIEAEN